MNKAKEKIKITIIIFLLIFFLYTLRRIQVDSILNIDILIYDLIIRNEFLTSIMKFITLFGEWFTIVLLCIIFLVFLKDKRDAVAIIINSIVVTVITHGLKFIVQRPRPEDMNLIDMSGYSFPSGHTTTAVAFYGFLIYLIYRNIKNKKQKSILITLLMFLIINIPISRIYLGVHYMSDVLAGISIATIHLIIFIYFYTKFMESSHS